MKGPKCRVAMYSPGMVGFGHIRRNASIAQALCYSALQPVIVMRFEADTQEHLEEMRRLLEAKLQSLID